MEVSRLGNVAYTIKHLIEELDKKSMYYEENKRNLINAYNIASKAYNDILKYNCTYKLKVAHDTKLV